MKNLLLLAAALFMSVSCCNQQKCDQETAQCPTTECPKGKKDCPKGKKDCPKKDQCPKQGQCQKDQCTKGECQKGQCPKAGQDCCADCPKKADCPHQGQCPKQHCQKDGQCPNKVKFVPENCPAKPVNVQAYSDGLQHIGLPTAEVQKTIDFYTGLGFTLATRHDINGRDFAFMKLGNCLIEVIPNDNPTMRAGAVDHICLNVTKIEELYKKIKDAGYKMIDQNIVDIAFWEKGARYFFIEGPNKERIEFCEIVK